jgi:precorrin-2/cobalt-factor-2 C20-methyltransferase
VTSTTSTTITFIDTVDGPTKDLPQTHSDRTSGTDAEGDSKGIPNQHPSKGVFYGVGVGPGASDLITLRALRIIEEADVLAIPRPSDFGRSVAWGIVRPHVESSSLEHKRAEQGRNPQERLFLTFPMSKDPEVLVPAWSLASKAICERLGEGKSVAFLTQGDPYIYSTFVYLEERIKEALPGVCVQVVPGVTSLSAVPIAAGIPLADGQERVAVIPATYGLDELRTVLRSFDAILIMKVSSMISQVVELLKEEGLADCATYVERASSQEERVVRNIREMTQDRCVYFSMVFVHKKNRSGILTGRQHGKSPQTNSAHPGISV